MLLFKSIKLIFRASPLTAVATFLVSIVAAVIPSILALLSAKCINSIGYANATLYAICWILLLLFSNVFSIITDSLTERLGENLTGYISEAIIKKTATLKDLYNLENPDFHSDIHLLQTLSSSRPVNLVANIVLNLKNIIIVASMLCLLGTINLLFPFILALCIIPGVILSRKVESEGWHCTKENDISERKAEYFVQMMLDSSLIKDTLFLAAGSFALKEYRKNRRQVVRENQKIRAKKAAYLLFSAALSATGNIAVFALTFRRIQNGLAGVGELILFLQSFFQVQIYLSDLVTFTSYLSKILLYFDTFFHFMDWENIVNEGNLPLPATYGNAFLEFRNVSFRYPETERDVLSQVSFKIAEGEHIAFVGENGAGKSTIIKLLLRFYEPTEGEILFRGVNISSIKINEWRNIIACVFQDFARYKIPIYDSVTLPYAAEEEREEAIKKSLAAATFPLEKGNALLGKDFGGIELSGGQHQRLAIARAIMRKNRGSSFLILDEPTAAIDPIEEAKLFCEFKSLSEDCTSILITHRLASATDADKIIVLSDGCKIEEGTHSELIVLRGTYKTMFDAQAEKYR